MELSKGFLKKYTLLGRELGSGTYSTVQLGRDNISGESVAVKRIKREGIKEKDKKKLFNEFAILKKLRHQNVVQIFECYEQPTEYLMVMEFIGGGSLLKVQKDYMSEIEVRHTIHQLATALQYCKGQGVVHRDIKPENVLLSESGVVKLVDFNLSKLISPEAMNFSLLETKCGTPNYVAPEVIAGHPYSYKCDIWSLGVLAFFLLSGGILPFQVPDNEDVGAALRQLLKLVRAADWRFAPEEVWFEVSDQSKAFVKGCMKKNADERFTYEQVLSHPWFRLGSDEVLHEKIDISPILQYNQKKRILVAGAVQEAVKTMGALMGPPQGNVEKKTELHPSGSKLFDLSMSELT